MHRLLTEKEISSRMPINKSMKKIKRDKNLTCNNYYRCIKNFQFLLTNYIGNNAPYCINLSAIQRGKILNGLQWMEKYLKTHSHEENEKRNNNSSNIVTKTKMKLQAFSSNSITSKEMSLKSVNSMSSLNVSTPKETIATNKFLVDLIATDSGSQMYLKNIDSKTPTLSENPNANTIANNTNINIGAINHSTDDLKTEIEIIDSDMNDSNENGNGSDGDRMELIEILKLLDLAVDEMCRLMQTDSLTRFVATKQYKKFYKQFGNNLIAQRQNVSGRSRKNSAKSKSISIASLSPKAQSNSGVPSMKFNMAIASESK